MRIINYILQAVLFVGYIPAMAANEDNLAKAVLLKESSSYRLVNDNENPANKWRFIKAKVIGNNDSRRIINQKDTEVTNAVGMVVCSAVLNNRKYTAVGTGTVVGSRGVVITASHNFYAIAQGRPRIKYNFSNDCVFRLHNLKGEIIFQSHYDKVEFGDYINNNYSHYEDWAVLKLNKEVPGFVNPIDYREFKMGQNSNDIVYPIEIYAFHNDKRGFAKRILHSSGMLVKIVDRGMLRLAHTADTHGRASGGSLLYELSDSKKVIIGLHTASYDHINYNQVVPIGGKLLKALDRMTAEKILML